MWKKSRVIKDAKKGRLTEPKTTRHVLVQGGKEHTFHHNGAVEVEINYSLELLKKL